MAFHQVVTNAEMAVQSVCSCDCVVGGVTAAVERPVCQISEFGPVPLMTIFWYVPRPGMDPPGLMYVVGSGLELNRSSLALALIHTSGPVFVDLHTTLQVGNDTGGSGRGSRYGALAGRCTGRPLEPPPAAAPVREARCSSAST